MAVLDVGPTSSPSKTVTVAISLGLVVHQVFRKYETYNILVHAALLLLPPALVVALTPPPHWSLSHAVFTVYATYLFTLIASVVVYRLSPFHPLARYPGPIGCKISKFYLGGISISGYSHKYIKSLHDRYGEVVRTGPNELSICNSSLISPLLGPNGVPKGPMFIGRVLSDTNLPMVGIQNMDVHLNRRKNWTRGLSQAALKEYEHLLANRIRQIVARLEEQNGEIIMGNWFGYFTYDFMSDMAFGGGSELLEAGHDEGNVWALLDDAMLIATLFAHVPWLGPYIGKVPAATGNLIILLNRCMECAAERVRRGSKTKDLFHYLNQEDLPDTSPPPMQQLVDDGVLAIIAGADTTSGALTSLIYCLLTHPEVYARLQEEVDKYYPQGENALDTKHHRNMPYLTAVIDETLRVYPPVPSGSQRQVPASGPGVSVGDVYIPPGTIFCNHVYTHHYSPKHFSPFPSSFWPERWLLASGELSPSDPSARGVDMDTFVHDESAFIPFSYGPMNCVGKNLAMQEMRMVVCALLQRFRFRLGEGWDEGRYEREYRDYFTSPRIAYPVVLEVR